jgi:hypothetical protein
MAHPWHHALSSAKRWGGRPEDYLAVHAFFDDSKRCLADLRHRALRHHAEGVFLAEQLFGPTVTITGRLVPTRWVGEQHVKEDLGWVPTAQDWLRHLRVQPWMGRAGRLPLRPDEMATAPPSITAVGPAPELIPVPGPIDWRALARQKTWLENQAETSTEAAGLLHLLAALQDAAVDRLGLSEALVFAGLSGELISPVRRE